MKLKRFLLALVAVISLALVGNTCQSKLTEKELSQAGQHVSIVDYWGGQYKKNANGGWRHITLVLANPTDKDIKVRARCVYKSDGAEFGHTVLTVKSKHKAKTVVRGFPRVISDTVTCSLSPAE